MIMMATMIKITRLRRWKRNRGRKGDNGEYDKDDGGDHSMIKMIITMAMTTKMKMVMISIMERR
jgi:hypothetical protein